MYFLINYRLSEIGQKTALKLHAPSSREQQFRIEVSDPVLADRLLELATVDADGVPRVYFSEPPPAGPGIVFQKFQQRPVEPTFAYYAGGADRRTVVRIPAVRDRDWNTWEFDAPQTIAELVAFADRKQREYDVALTSFKRREARKRKRWVGSGQELSALANDMIRVFHDNPLSRAEWDHKGRPYLVAPNRDGIWNGWVARFYADIRFIQEANRRRLLDRERLRREKSVRKRLDDELLEKSNRILAKLQLVESPADPVQILGTTAKSGFDGGEDLDHTPGNIERKSLATPTDPVAEHRTEILDLLGRFKKIFQPGKPTFRERTNPVEVWKSPEGLKDA